MNLLDAALLGLIEGITEFLPISSTAHLILISKLLHVQQGEFVKSFNIAIQLGAIFSVLTLYWRDLFTKHQVAKRIFVAFIPSAVIGLVFYKIIKSFLFESNAIIIGALILGGAGLIIFELLHKENESAISDIANISYTKCLIVGLFQSVAIIPGVSRSAATILGGLLLGFKRKTIVEFSFLLAVPTMLAATVLDLFESNRYYSVNEFGLLAVGFIISFIVALLSIKFLLKYIAINNFVPFGTYRIVIGVVFLFTFTI